MIVLLGPHSLLGLGDGGGDMLSCRGQRLCGSGLLAPGGVLELLHQTKRTPLPAPPLVSTVQGYTRSAHARGAHA